MKLELKSKMLIILCIFTLTFLVIGVITLLTVRDKVITIAHEKLHGDIAMAKALLNEKSPGEWAIQEGKLYKGSTCMIENNAFVDMVGEMTKDTVTIFQRNTRIATNVKNESGKRAIGTQAAENVTQAVLKEGKTYLGKAKVVGVWNQTAYEPIKNSQGEIVGMFYVGVPNTYFDKVIIDICIKIAIYGIFGFIIVFSLGVYLKNAIVKPISRVISGLTNGAEETSSVSHEVFQAAQQLSEGANNQAASLEQTAASLEEISSMTKNNTDNALQAKSMMDEARKIVNKVNKHMDDMSRAISEITKSNQETNKIIKTIEEIAFQTNLLALNAAVEAARAGEVGAGFAVVADEVRTLAIRASEAAKHTTELINNTMQAVTNGNELTRSTQEAYQENIKILENIGQLVDSVAISSKEQSDGIMEINLAISEIDRVTQQSSSHAVQSTEASDRMNNQVAQLKKHIFDLASLIGAK